MAIVRGSLMDILASPTQSDRAETPDAQIRRQIADDPDTAPELTLAMLSAPANLRRRLGMSPERFAAALGVPLATLKQWERDDAAIDPAARALLILVARDPAPAFAALAAARAAA